MRLLHTSDWHVGKQIRGRSRADEHRAVLAEIASIAAARSVDLILVAGDLFETAAPSPEAESVAYRALLSLAEVAPVVVVAGNHDHPARLEAVAPLLGLGRVTVLAQPSRPDDGGVVSTVAGGVPVELALLPFAPKHVIIRGDHLISEAGFALAQSYAVRLGAIVGALSSGFRPDSVNLLCGHAFVAGGLSGGGERSAHLVEDYAISPQAFDVGTQYVALGHLHRAQDVPGPTRIRYCGSPLQLDFGEVADAKSVTVVDLEPGVPAVVEEVGLRAGRALRAIQGTMAELEAMAGTTGDDWLRVVVRDDRRADTVDLIRSWFEFAVDVTVRADGPTAPRLEQRDLSAASPSSLFRTYLASSTDVADDRVAQLFDEILGEVT